MVPVQILEELCSGPAWPEETVSKSETPSTADDRLYFSYYDSLDRPLARLLDRFSLLHRWDVLKMQNMPFQNTLKRSFYVMDCYSNRI